MKVGELLDRLDSTRQERHIPVTLGEIEVAEDCSTLTANGERFVIDEMAENALASFLNIPRTYLAKCPSDLKAMQLRYWLDYRENAAATVEALDGNLIGIHRPDALLLPVRSVYEIVGRVFSENDDVRDMRRDDQRLHLDVTTQNHSISVPNPDELPNRPQVGDITAGGVRILAHPNEAKAPSVQSFLYRLVCMNGMTTPERDGVVRLKGHTVGEVLEELERAAERVLSGLDEKLGSYAAMAQRPIPGSPTAFVYQVAREYGLQQRVVNRLIDRANMLPANATLYDVQQIFTEVANSGVNYKTMLSLQTLGGSMAFDTERVLHRCNQCERLLPE